MMHNVKAQLRRKAAEERRFKRVEPQYYEKPEKQEKPPKNPAFFNPDEYAGDRPLMRDFRGIKGDAPEWVKEKYGKAKR